MLQTASDLQRQVEPKRKQRTLWGDAWVQFRRHKLAMFGLIVLTILVLAVLVGPLVWTIDPEYIDFLDLPTSHPVSSILLVPTIWDATCWPATSTAGRISLAVGVAAMAVSMLFGTLIGAMAGYFPKLDNPLMRFTDIMLALPQLPLLLVIITLFRDSLRDDFWPGVGHLLADRFRHWHSGLDAHIAHRARHGALHQGEGVCGSSGQHRHA